MIYKCFMCRKETGSDALMFKTAANTQLVEAVEKLHGEWFLDDGICAECIYKANAAEKGTGIK